MMSYIKKWIISKYKSKHSTIIKRLGKDVLSAIFLKNKVCY